MPSTQFTQPSVRTNHDQSLFSEITQQREILGKRKIPAKGAIGKLEAIGQVWSLNEKQRRKNKSLKRQGIKQINTYKKELNKMTKVVDETLMNIRKNI